VAARSPILPDLGRRADFGVHPQHSVVVLDNPVALWVIRDSPALIYPQKLIEVTHQLRLELGALVSVNMLW